MTIRVSKKALISALEKTGGLIGPAATILQISRGTAVRRIKEWDLQGLLTEFREANLDFSEKAINDCIRDPEHKEQVRTARWFLSQVGNSRGYISKRSIEFVDNTPQSNSDFYPLEYLEFGWDNFIKPEHFGHEIYVRKPGGHRTLSYSEGRNTSPEIHPIYSLELLFAQHFKVAPRRVKDWQKYIKPAPPPSHADKENFHKSYLRDHLLNLEKLHGGRLKVVDEQTGEDYLRISERTRSDLSSCREVILEPGLEIDKTEI